MPDTVLHDLMRCEGLFVGQLSEEELEVFDKLVKVGLARRSYEGGAGFMGLATVRFVRSGE